MGDKTWCFSYTEYWGESFNILLFEQGQFANLIVTHGGAFHE